MVIRMRTLVLVVATLLASGVTGCVTYRGGAVPHADVIAVNPPDKPVVVYTVRTESNVGDAHQLNKMVDTSLTSALITAGAVPRPSGADANPAVTMDVTVTANGNVAGHILSGFICGLTFFLIPGYAPVDVTMMADVTPRGGAARAYRYADSLTVWIQLFLLPFTNSSDEVTRDLFADMARGIVRDMQRDGVLPTQ